MVEHWQDITIYLSAGRAIPASWIKTLLPTLVAGMVGALTGMVSASLTLPERVSGIRADVEELKAQVIPNTMLIQRHDERLTQLRVEITNMEQYHQTIMARMELIEQSGPLRCLQCHMNKSKNHPHNRLPLP